jgi:hypothetical protein
MPARRRAAAALRSALALTLAAAAVGGPLVGGAHAAPTPPAVAATARYIGQVTDALRTPTHRFALGSGANRAAADLVFSDAQHARTTARTCVRRTDVAGVRTCFDVTTDAAGVATVTPLRFPRGSYAARWSVDGTVVARWRFTVSAGA